MNKVIKNDLGKDSIVKLVLGLAIPAMIAQLVNVLYSIVDRMFAGQIPEIGNMALAAIGVCGPIVTLLSSFGTLVGIGGSILMSIKLGQKKDEEAKDILYNSFIMLCIFSIVLTILFLIFKGQLIMWFGGSEELFDLANTYLSIYTCGTFFALMAIGMNLFITCQGFASIAMMSTIIGACTNIALDWLFIKALNLGISGAAIATVLAQILSSIFVVSFLISKYSHVKLRIRKCSTAIMKRILSLGFSPFMIIATDSIILIGMNALLQKYGQENGDMLITAVTIAQSYFLLITGPLLGISSGTQTIISYNFGAKDTKRIQKAIIAILSMGVGFCAIMFFVSMFGSEYFVHFFTSSEEIKPLAIKAIKIFCIGVVPMAFQYVLVDVITALSNVKVSLALSLNRKITFLIATFLLPLFFDAEMIFAAEPIADIYAFCVTTTTFLITFAPFMRDHGMEVSKAFNPFKL